MHSSNSACSSFKFKKSGNVPPNLTPFPLSFTLRYGTHSMDLHRALSGREKGVPTVVLAHQPRAASEAVMWNDVRLVLSGHTHAGQIFPWNIAIYLGNPFFVGLYEPLPGVFVYVSPGSMFYLIPFRHYRPEITHITLISS